mgnify:CR=1 FL=1
MTNTTANDKIMKQTDYYKSHFVDKAIIVFFILWGIATIFKVAGAEPQVIIDPPCDGVLRIGIKNPPVAKRFGLMVSTNLKDWELAKDENGIKCIRAYPNGYDSTNEIVWWYIKTNQKAAFFRVSR